MKRCLVLAVLASAAMLVLTGPASAIPPTAAKRGNPESVSSTVTPKRDRTRPYRFRVSGAVRLPSRFCAAGGVTPGPSRSPANCIPLNCPPGASNARYCARPTIGQVCSGQLRIRFKRGTRTIVNKRVRLASNCRYTSRSTITRRLTRGQLRVSVQFLGNSYLKPKSASTKTVRVG